MSPSDEALILYFYGEHEAPDEIERQLAADPALASRYEALRRDLRALDGLTPPDPRPGLEARMWARIEPSLTPSRAILPRVSWLRWAAISGALAATAIAAFLAGRLVRTTPTEIDVAAELKGLTPAARERVLEAALIDHLESSQRLLLEVANGSSPLAGEREAAVELLDANRLYQRAAERAGKPRIAAVLTELDVLLRDLAHTPGSSDLRTQQARAESEDLLFKLRIARNNLKRLS